MSLHTALSNLEMALARIEAVQSKLQPAIKGRYTEELDDARADIRRAMGQVAEHECPLSATKLETFISQHRHCDDQIIADTDVAPDVVRLDCLSCNANIQVPV